MQTLIWFSAVICRFLGSHENGIELGIFIATWAGCGKSPPDIFRFLIDEQESYGFCLDRCRYGIWSCEGIDRIEDVDAFGNDAIAFIVFETVEMDLDAFLEGIELVSCEAPLAAVQEGLGMVQELLGEGGEAAHETGIFLSDNLFNS